MTQPRPLAALCLSLVLCASVLTVPALAQDAAAAVRMAERYGIPQKAAAKILARERVETGDIRMSMVYFKRPSGAMAAKPDPAATQRLSFDLNTDAAEALETPNSPPFLAALHDTPSGRPYVACVMPCELDYNPDRPSIVSITRDGSRVRMGAPGLFLDGAGKPVTLTPNAIERVQQRMACNDAVARRAVATADADAEVCFGAIPMMPPRTRRSGHCDLRVTVAPDGTAEAVSAECTDRVLCEAVRPNVDGTEFLPAVGAGNRVVDRVLRFKLDDGRGREIKARSGKMKSCKL